MTGRPTSRPGSGDQTLSVSQSPPPDDPVVPNPPGCGGGGPNVCASRTPSQGRGGTGAAKRSSATGGAANGMPRKTATPASTAPRTRPAVVRASITPARLTAALHLHLGFSG